MLKLHSVILDTKIVEKVDKMIDRSSRSEWIREAIEEKLNDETR